MDKEHGKNNNIVSGSASGVEMLEEALEEESIGRDVESKNKQRYFPGLSPKIEVSCYSYCDKNQRVYDQNVLCGGQEVEKYYD